MDMTVNDKLAELKDKVRLWQDYFKENNDRFKEFKRFVFKTSLDASARANLKQLGKPPLEFNILESIISRLRGEFMGQEPSIVVRSIDGLPAEKLQDEEFMLTQKVVESYMKAKLVDSQNDGLQYQLFSDTLGGGFAVCKIFTQYLNDRSFDQEICVEHVVDPTLCGFDPMAKLSHKGDGNFAFELYPYTRGEFEREFGKKATEKMRFTTTPGGFNWSFYLDNNRTEVCVVCDFYEKRYRKVKIVKLADGKVMTKKEYEAFIEDWRAQLRIEVPPAIVQERQVDEEYLYRYRFCETEILDEEETDYTYFPLIFIDGNSVMVSNTDKGGAVQMTRPYAYHAMGIQQLKNFCGETIAADIENMVQHKFLACVESIPDDYMEAYRNPQKANTLLYKAFMKGDPNHPLPPPREIQNVPMPPIVESIFMGSDRVTQTILGNYDMSMGDANQRDISGKAIANGVIHTSAASAPYLQSYTQGLNRIAQVLLDMIPKYYKTPRTLPIITPEGKREFILVNDEEGLKLQYDARDLEVIVEAGVNSSLQKQMALDQIVRMMQSSETFAQFVNTKGLEILLDNLEIRGIDQMKAKAAEFMQELQEQKAREQQMMEQQAQQGDPQQQMIQMAAEVEQAKIEQQKEESEGKFMLESAKLSLEQEKLNIEKAKVASEIDTKIAKVALEQEKVNAERTDKAIETALQVSERLASPPSLEE